MTTNPDANDWPVVRCVRCDLPISPSRVKGLAWIDATGGDGCGDEVHCPPPSVDPVRLICDCCGTSETVERLTLDARLAAVPRLLDRIEPGGEVPAGECRSCGALVYVENLNRGR